jgi:xylan 1,4-beta-xylosidase
METPYGQIILMSLVTNRFLQLDPATGALTAVAPGPKPDAKDGVRFEWEPA